ncbi:MAG: NAD(P)H-hydrate dehydratase [Verrucomicrobia bacterium]|jgi:ADP-dependent NAD(P)H-hydrate dehydratase / NAD(P)H-hydrate epimerase|nr:NAD(P)H-hydrate dehydratase [Verrucomicrobiota bacterium]
MKTVLTAEMQELDRRTITEFGVPGEVLMDRAGYGVADVARHLARTCGFGDVLVQLFAGRGNNGGDAFVAARYLKKMGFEVEVFFAGEASAVRGDALKHLLQMRADGIELRELATLDEWGQLQATPQAAGDILIDGLLGTGITGPARGPVVGAIQVINTFARRGLVVAIDVPSGLNADSGVADGDVVAADVTVTMGMPKRGLLEPCAVDVVGNVETIDIGIPEALTDPIRSPAELITIEDVSRALGRRARTSHKGSYGHVLLVGGAPGYAGAIAMSAMAAVRSGVGLVSVLTPESVTAVVAGLVPEAMVHAGEANAAGSLSAAALKPLEHELNRFDAVLIGPGMTAHPDTAVLVGEVLQSEIPSVILDADALNVLATTPGLIPADREGIILTPHPGEMARLCERTVASVQEDRFAVALSAAEQFGATIVLKGAGTVVAGKDSPLCVNLAGNPGMATGGMGDVLAGLMAGLAAQNMAPFDAARAAVHIHGRAGDAVARLTSQAGMAATDVIDEIPQVFRGILGR